MPGRLPCGPDCTCKKHTRVFPKLGPCPERCQCAKHREWTLEERHKHGEVRIGHEVSEETRRKLSEVLRREPNRLVTADGYINLTGQVHPLAAGGAVPEHRQVLYDKIGPGEHPCHWCGKLLAWGGKGGIHADHVDEDVSNNDPANLVASCLRCNWGRNRVYRPELADNFRSSE